MQDTEVGETKTYDWSTRRCIGGALTKAEALICRTSRPNTEQQCSSPMSVFGFMLAASTENDLWPDAL